MVAEPLERGLCEALPWLSQQEQKLLSKSLVQDFSWDDLSANSVWAFGPHANPSNLLVDFSLPDDTDPMRLGSVKESLK